MQLFRTGRGRRLAFLPAIALAALTISHGPSPSSPELRPVAAPTKAFAGSPSRATWVWTQPPASQLIPWARANKVRTIFLQVPARLPSSPSLAWAKSVSRAAHANGIKVSALNGDPGWLARPESALAWQRAALSTGLFDGIHVDVEPWGQPNWGTSRTTLVRQYLGLLRTLANATTLPVEADIAYWLNTVPAPGGEPLDRAVMKIVDAVTVMSYRNRVDGADGITGVGAQALRTARATRTPCRLAAETIYYGQDKVSRKQTFHHEKRSTLQTVLNAVDRSQTKNGYYAGMAVHHYDAWRAMRG